MSLLATLGFAPATKSPEAQGLVEALEASLGNLEPRRARLVAAFAGLLVRVAYADDEISVAELGRIEDLIADHMGLDREEARVVAAIAKHKSVLLHGAENYLLTRSFNDVASEAEKRRLIDCLYAVACADDV